MQYFCTYCLHVSLDEVFQTAKIWNLSAGKAPTVDSVDKPTGTASVAASTRDCVFAATTTSNIIKSTVEAVQGTQESREFSRVCEFSEF